MRCLAIIPARSGSKGLVHKNIKLLAGEPLMAHTIQAAAKSGCFAKIMVSTDSEEYAEVARRYGAEVPFLRSQENASDKASSWSVVEEVLNAYEKEGQRFTHVCLLQPTSPLRTAADIQGAFSRLEACNAKAVVSVCPAEHSPLLCNVLDETGSMEGFLASKNQAPRQKMDTYYRLNGAIYLTQCDFLREDSFLYRDGCVAYIMEQIHSIDIDTELDFQIASLLIQTEEK